MKEENFQIPPKYKAARPQLVRLAFALSMSVIATGLRSAHFIGTIILAAQVAVFAGLRVALLCMKASSRAAGVVDWMAAVVQFSSIVTGCRVAVSSESLLQLVFAMPLLQVQAEHFTQVPLRIFMMGACLLKRFENPETYVAIVAANFPFLTDLAVWGIYRFQAKPQISRPIYLDPQETSKALITQTRTSVVDEGRLPAPSPEHSGRRRSPVNLFSQRLGDPESLRLNLSIQKDAQVKKTSLLSEKIEGTEKESISKRNLKSQLSLVDPTVTARQQFKKLHRQLSLDNHKKAASQQHSSNQ